MTTVGVIGLGKMGLPIARNLLERGFPVIGFRRTPLRELEGLGGELASSSREVAARSDVLLSILPDVPALEEVLNGPDGTLSAMRPGTVHIEMSTVDVDHKARLRDAVRAAGGDMLDAPMSGSPPMVAPRLATTLVSGDPVSVDHVRHVLDAISGPWVYTGPFGTGARMKYVANLLLAIHTVAAAEAYALARSFGLDLELVQETLNGSIASSTIWERRGPLMRERNWFPAQGPISTLHPILEQIAQAAAGGIPLPAFEAAKAVFDAAQRDGWGDLDIAAVHDRLTGTTPDLPHDASSVTGAPA